VCHLQKYGQLFSVKSISYNLAKKLQKKNIPPVTIKIELLAWSIDYSRPFFLLVAIEIDKLCYIKKTVSGIRRPCGIQ
jgi:hypothetical protein